MDKIVILISHFWDIFLLNIKNIEGIHYIGVTLNYKKILYLSTAYYNPFIYNITII